MTKNDLLDNFEEHDPRAIQEPFEYRMLLTLSWLIWSVWSFYDGTVVLRVIQKGQGLLPMFPYHMGMVYEHYYIGTLTLGMAVVIFKKSENRIYYLFSFVGVTLAQMLIFKIYQGAIIVFLPMVFLLFLRNLRACLICYALSLLLYVLVSNNIFDEIEHLLTNPRRLLIYGLIFMTAFSYRTRLFPLSSVIIKLRYRLFFLFWYLPLIVDFF
ncbi:MAG: hypothetical protein ACI976_002082 [Aureispira sp.]|jgi:hypothetical protein